MKKTDSGTEGPMAQHGLAETLAGVKRIKVSAAPAPSAAEAAREDAVFGVQSLHDIARGVQRLRSGLAGSGLTIRKK
jgi:hypothetical protein